MKMKDVYMLRCLDSNVNIGLDEKVKLINDNILSEVSNLHYALKFNYVVEKFGIKEICGNYIIPRKSTSVDKIDKFLLEREISSYTLINPFGSGHTRRLTKEKLLEIISYLHHSSLPNTTVILSAPDTRKIVDEMHICDNKFVYHFGESDSIYDAIAIVDRANYIISVDTSIVHIAAGLSKRQIAIYKNDSQNYRDWNPNSELAQSVFATDDINEFQVEKFLGI